MRKAVRELFGKLYRERKQGSAPFGWSGNRKSTGARTETPPPWERECVRFYKRGAGVVGEVCVHVEPYRRCWLAVSFAHPSWNVSV